MSGLAIGISTAAIGGAQFFKGLSDRHKDEKALSALKQPFYKIQDELIQNRNQSEQLAGQGLPTAQRDYMTQEAQRGLGSGLDAILRAGGGVNDASLLLSQYNQQIGKVGSEDAAQHLANIQYFQKANADVAAEKTKQWSINEYQPYEAKLKELKQNVATNQANQWQGLTTAVGGVTAGLTANSNAGLIKKLFADKSTGQTQDPFKKQLPGVAPTKSGVTSPAASVTGINPNVNSPLNTNGYDPNYPLPNFDPDTWGALRMDAWSEGSNIPDN
jgi:hypothetical protein